MSPGPNRPLRIVIIDPSEVFRLGLKTTLATATTPPISVVGEASSLAEGLAACTLHRPDIVILDVQLPDSSGPEACQEISGQLPGTRMIVLAWQASDSLVYDAVTAGAQGYLLKDISSRDLIQALVDAAAGKSILSPEATSRVMRMLRGRGGPERPNDLATLSGQERRVLACVADGLTNKQTGEKLGLSDNTVKNYLVSVFEKLGVKRRSQAAAMYVQGANRKR